MENGKKKQKLHNNIKFIINEFIYCKSITLTRIFYVSLNFSIIIFLYITYIFLKFYIIKMVKYYTQFLCMVMYILYSIGAYKLQLIHIYVFVFHTLIVSTTFCIRYPLSIILKHKRKVYFYYPLFITCP